MRSVNVRSLGDARSKKSPQEAEAPAPAGRSRVAWTANLDPDELKTEGGVLLAMLIARANELGQTLKEMASELGVTYGYIFQLRTGDRLMENISNRFADQCALYLNVPRMAVLRAAGRVRQEDIFTSSPNLFMEVPAAIDFIRKDPEFGTMLPPSFLSMPPREQLFIVLLYERATGRKLLSADRIDEKTIAIAIAELEEYRDSLRKSSAEQDATEKTT